MILSRHLTTTGPCWFADSAALDPGLKLGALLAIPRSEMREALRRLQPERPDPGLLLPPAEPEHEIWAAGLTYLRSRDERQAESTAAELYGRVYEAERPELFFKATGARVVGSGGKIRIRSDSAWNVPEPELTLVFNAFGEIVGYTAGNDVSSRSIEGENPLYLPQAKSYDGACALGPGIVLADAESMADLAISCAIVRDVVEVYSGETRTRHMKRGFVELASYLLRELSFPVGGFLLTGTGIVPGPEFTLHPGDVVTVGVGELTLVNEVAGHR